MITKTITTKIISEPAITTSCAWTCGSALGAGTCTTWLVGTTTANTGPARTTVGAPDNVRWAQRGLTGEKGFGEKVGDTAHTVPPRCRYRASLGDIPGHSPALPDLRRWASARVGMLGARCHASRSR